MCTCHSSSGQCGTVFNRSGACKSLLYEHYTNVRYAKIRCSDKWSLVSVCLCLARPNCQRTWKTLRLCCWTFNNLNMNILEEFLSGKCCISANMCTCTHYTYNTMYSKMLTHWVWVLLFRHSFSCSPMKWCTFFSFFFCKSLSIYSIVEWLLYFYSAV